MELSVISQRDTEKKIQSLLALMTQHIEQGNWPQVRQIDIQFRDVLAASKKAPWYGSFQPKLVLLKAYYKKNITTMIEQQAVLKNKMTRHLNDCEGIVAYQQLIEGDY